MMKDPSARDIGYIFLEWIAECSMDPWAKKAARQAMAAFRLANQTDEGIEVDMWCKGEGVRSRWQATQSAMET